MCSGRQDPAPDRRDRRRPGGEAVAGREGGGHAAVRLGSRPPAVRGLGVVAGLAQPLSVAGRRGATVLAGLDVVDVPHGGVAPGGPAGAVAEADEPGEVAAEGARARVHADELPGGGRGVEPPDAHLLLRGDGAAHDLPGQLGRDRAEPVEVGLVVGATEQRGVGHHDAEGDRGGGHDRGGVGRGDPEHRGDQRVGHHLATAALLTRGTGPVGLAEERGVDRDAFLDGQQRGQPGHRVGGRAQRHAALGLGVASAGDAGRRVEPLGLRAQPGQQPARAELLERVGVAGDGLVHGQAVGERQAGGLPRDHGRGPLVDAPVLPGRPRVRELGLDDPGQAEVPPAAVR